MSDTSIIFAKTNQLSTHEREEIRKLFYNIYKKIMTEDMFERKFLGTPKGYSYHSLLLCDKKIVGAFSAVPWRYKFFGRENFFCVQVDTMIEPGYRGRGHWVKMAKRVHEGLIDEEIPFIFGFPNENFYPLQKRFLKYDDIGELDFYVMPLNIGNIIRKKVVLNYLSRAFFRIAAPFYRMPMNNRINYQICKIINKNFEYHRYDRSYSKITIEDGAYSFYKVYEEGQVRALYIIDVYPLTAHCFTKAVQQIYKRALDSIDIIIYVGRLVFKPIGLFKVPDSRKPRSIRMTGKILIPELVDRSVFNIDNWRVNISDFDVR